jgi:Putative DNA-binding domain
MNSTLAELQSLLYRLITAPGGVEETARLEPALKERGLEAVISGNKRLTAGERLGIYANAYFYRLQGILKEDFPCTYMVLGDVDFHNLITGYLIEYPPNEPSVLYAGQHLPRYVQTTSVLAGTPLSQLPFLADLARLERACIEVFHGPDAQALELAFLRDLPPESWPSLRMRLHPAAQLLDIGWSIDALMAAIKEGRSWEPPSRASAALLVWRQKWQVRYRPLEPREHAALTTAAAISDFASICAAFADEVESTAGVADEAATINRMFMGWLHDGILTIA